MLVYRIENDKGNGPYNSEWKYVEKLRQEHNKDYKRPSPYLSNIDFNFEIDKFGFINLRSYKNWFTTKWRTRFKKHNFKLNVYYVNKQNIKIGYYQLAFEQSECKFIKSLDPIEMRKI